MGLDEYANMCDCYEGKAVMCRDCHNKQMNEQESRDQVTPLIYQLKKWQAFAREHLPPTDCDRDDVECINKKIADLQAEVAELQGVLQSVLSGDGKATMKRIEQVIAKAGGG